MGTQTRGLQIGDAGVLGTRTGNSQKLLVGIWGPGCLGEDLSHRPGGPRIKDGGFGLGAGLGSQGLRIGGIKGFRSRALGPLGCVLGSQCLDMCIYGTGTWRPVGYDQRACGPGWRDLSTWYWRSKAWMWGRGISWAVLRTRSERQRDQTSGPYGTC